MDESQGNPQAQTFPQPSAAVLWWFQLLLWGHIVMGIALFAYRASWLGYIGQLRNRGGMWLSPAVAYDLASGVGLAIAVIVSAFGCLKRRPRARIGLLICSVAAMAIPFIDIATSNHIAYSTLLGFWYRLRNPIQWLVIPLITILFLDYPPIRTQFIAEGRRLRALEKSEPAR